MIEVQAPNDYKQHKGVHSIFLGGSIEMGRAEDWQKRVVAAFSHVDVLLLNPRRDDWQVAAEQSVDNPYFVEQVQWELDALDHADTILLYFSPETKSPISLLELGFYASANPQKVIVCCPEGFWRKGNVDVVCGKYGIRQVDDLTALIKAVYQRAVG